MRSCRFEPVACDLMDRRHLSLARESDSRLDSVISSAAEALLLVEMDGDDLVQVRERLRQMVDRVRFKKRLAFDSLQTSAREEIELCEQLAKKTVPTLYRLKGSTRALPFVEDLAIPPETLPKFLVEMQNVLKRHQVTATLFAHAGHGQIHLRPFLDLSDPAHVRTMELLAGDLYEVVFDVRGTISGEHGDGLSRTAFIPRQYGDLAQVFAEIKRIFDPQNTFNPGKVVGNDPYLLTRNLRPPNDATAAPAAPATNGEPSPPRDLFELHLNWTKAELSHMARSCNGCGACRTSEPGSRMCPIFRFAPAEEASPRAKANLIRGLLTGQLPPDAIRKPDFKAVADLCVNCHMCRLECPAGNRHSADDDRSQGGLRGQRRIAAGRLGADAARLVQRAGHRVEPAGELGPGQSAVAVADGKDTGAGARPQAAPLFPAQFPPPSPSAPAHSAHARAPAARCCTSSTPMPTITTRNWAKPWWP